jgi:hypothetical protein
MNVTNGLNKKKMLLSVIVLLTVSLILILPYAELLAAHAGSEISESAYSEKDSAENNMDKLILLEKNRFENLDRYQIVELARYLVKMGAYDLGISEPVHINIRKLKEKEYSYFSTGTNTITLSEDLILSNDPYLLAEAINHELFHCAQCAFVRIYRDKLTEKEKNLYFIRKSSAPIYEYEIRNYKTSSDEEGFLGYFFQLVELDALEWSQETTDRYFDMIGSYLSEHFDQRKTKEVILKK